MKCYTKIPSTAGMGGEWVYWNAVEGGPYLTVGEKTAPEGAEIIEGPPPSPEGGWKNGDEVIVRTVVYAGPQWEYRRMRLEGAWTKNSDADECHASGYYGDTYMGWVE